MTRRFIQIKGELHEVSQDWTPEPAHEYHVVGDIDPYRSMVDGSIITSRSRHREHLKDHGVVEVGNDSLVKNPVYRGQRPPPGLKDLLIRVANQTLKEK